MLRKGLHTCVSEKSIFQCAEAYLVHFFVLFVVFLYSSFCLVNFFCFFIFMYLFFLLFGLKICQHILVCCCLFICQSFCYDGCVSVCQGQHGGPDLHSLHPGVEPHGVPPHRLLWLGPGCCCSASLTQHQRSPALVESHSGALLRWGGLPYLFPYIFLMSCPLLWTPSKGLAMVETSLAFPFAASPLSILNPLSLSPLLPFVLAFIQSYSFNCLLATHI